METYFATLPICCNESWHLEYALFGDLVICCFWVLVVVCGFGCRPGVFGLMGKEELDRGAHWGVYIDLEEGPGCAMKIQRTAEVLFKCILM